MADKVAAQKAALEIVVGFLVEGLPNEFGATIPLGCPRVGQGRTW